MNDLHEKYMKWYQECFLIRKFEQMVEKAFLEGNMRGTTHGCIGQEIIPVMVMEFINKDIDYVVGTHRCHGQVISYSHDPYKLFCEMMGKKDGFVNGLGGSQHIKVGNYFTNGITGGMVSVGCGIALGLKKDKSDGIVIIFLGDGGFNEGYVQEALNLASTMKLSTLFIMENNHYAMSTHTEMVSAGSFMGRVKALDIQYVGVSTDEIEKLYYGIEDSINYVRKEKEPCFIEIKTARLCGHSKSDNRSYMSEEEKRVYEENDPLIKIEKEVGFEYKEKMIAEIESFLDDAYLRAIQCQEMIMEE